MTTTTDPLPPGASRGSRLSRRIYLPRVIGLALGGLAVGAGLAERPGLPAGLWALLLFNALLWPHLAYALASRAPGARRAEMANLLIDALMGGLWVVAMQGRLLPSVLILAMLSMNNVATGGLRFLGLGLAAQSVGGALGGTLFGWHFVPGSGFLVQLACLPFLVVYPLTIGMVTLRLAHELNRQRTELRSLSEIDPLSGLYNRRFFERRLAEEFENARRHGAALALAVGDIDHFKTVNDTHGHPAGDSVIRIAGKVLRQEVRRSDVVARIGGDEFVVLMPFTRPDEARELILRLQQAFARAVPDDPRLAGTTLSFGVAAPHAGMKSGQEWLALADQALYRAKERARGSVEVA